METISCGHCKQALPPEAFNPSQRRNGKWCKACLQADYRAKAGPPAPPRDCEWCGTTIPTPLGKQRFCSPNCKQRERWKREHPKDGNVCQVCGIDISHMRSNAKWCSESCARKRPANVEVQRRARVKKAYGMTLEEVDALFETQGRVCAICASDSPKTHHEQWHIDHDHATGKVRGLLCGPCNTGLGQLQDDPRVLRAALSYVTEHRN